MKNIYLVTCLCLNAHLCGSSIVTIIDLAESHDPAFLLQLYHVFFRNYIPWIIEFHGYMYSYNVRFRVE